MIGPVTRANKTTASKSLTHQEHAYVEKIGLFCPDSNSHYLRPVRILEEILWGIQTKRTHRLFGRVLAMYSGMAGCAEEFLWI